MNACVSEEEREDRRDRRDGLLDAAQVQDEEDAEARRSANRSFQLRSRESAEEAADRVGARRERDRDREHVVDEQRGAGQDSDRLAEQLARDRVAAAARGELLDDAAVARADDEDRDRGREREEDGEADVLAERLERLLGAVGARREPVGAEPDPREDRDERDLVEGAGIAGILRRADEDPRDLGADGRLGHQKRSCVARHGIKLDDQTAIAQGCGGPVASAAATSPEVQNAVLPAVREVDDEPEAQPDREPQPVLDRQREHQQQAGQDAEDRHERHRAARGTAGRRSGCVLRMISTAAQTITKASSVPMLTRSARTRSGRSPASSRDEDAGQDRRLPRRPELRVDGAEEALREQAVARHGQQHARLAEHHHQQDRGDPGERAERDQELGPGQADLRRRRRRPGRRC